LTPEPRPYPGYPAYVERAREALDASDVVAALAKGQPALHELSNLIGQALARPEGPHPDTVRRARELARALCVAAEAALHMQGLIEPADAPALPSPYVNLAARDAATPVGLAAGGNGNGRGRRNG